MARERIQVRDSQAKMIVDEVAVSTVNIEDVARLYVITHENALFHGDEPFYVALFRDSLWVIPFFTPGVDEFIRGVSRGPGERTAIFRAVSRPLPFRWRKRLMGFFPVFPVPRLAQHPLSTLPELQGVEPVRRPEAAGMMGGEDNGGG